MEVALLLALLCQVWVARGWSIEWGVANKTECDRICVNNTVCSQYIGWKLKFGQRSPDDDPAVQCKFLTGNDYYYTATNLTKYLGDGGVLVLTGDSLVRHVFVELLNWLGDPYSTWWHHLHEVSTQWRGQPRDKLEHTYVCSPPLGPRNLTMAFLWHPFFGDHLTSVPFLPLGDPERCSYRSDKGMQHCDHALPDGALQRWACADALDSVQLPGKPRRKFIVLASAGGHTAVEELMAARDLNMSATLQSAAGRFRAGWDKLEAGRQHWSSISRGGGRNIFLTPARLSYGAPRTVMSNHNSADRMEKMLEVFIRSRLRAPSNLTCGDDGIETVDTAPIFYHENAPGSSGDGMHQEQISNIAMIQLLIHRLVGFTASTWRHDTASWNSSSFQSSSCSW